MYQAQDSTSDNAIFFIIQATANNTAVSDSLHSR
jgi:hypothetical protein